MENIWITIITWILENYVEIIATFTGLIYVYLSVKQNIWLWIFGIITSTLYIYVFFISKLYANMSLQFYYVFISLYGWILWSKNKSNNSKAELFVSKTNNKLAVVLLLITIVIFILYTVVLKKTDSTIFYLDAFTTSASITATWMLARKKIEHWIIWIVVNIIYVGLYFNQELYPTLLLYAVYTILAVIGYFKWKKELISKE